MPSVLEQFSRPRHLQCLQVSQVLLNITFLNSEPRGSMVANSLPCFSQSALIKLLIVSDRNLGDGKGHVAKDTMQIRAKPSQEPSPNWSRTLSFAAASHSKTLSQDRKHGHPEVKSCHFSPQAFISSLFKNPKRNLQSAWVRSVGCMNDVAVAARIKWPEGGANQYHKSK